MKKLSDAIPNHLKPKDQRKDHKKMVRYLRKIERLMTYDQHVLAITLAGIVESGLIDNQTLAGRLKRNAKIERKQIQQQINEQLHDK